MRIRVGHLYPDRLNIYADRGNIAVLSARAAARGHELEVTPIGLGDACPTADLFYVGGGQDREQALVAPDLAAKGPALHEAVDGGRRVPRGLRRLPAPRPLLPRPRRRRAARHRPAAAAHGRRRAAHDRRRPARLRAGPARRSRASRTTPAARILDEGAEPLGRVIAGFGNDGASGHEGCRAGRVYGTYLHGPLLPRNPWLADRLLADALAHATGGEVELEPLADELEAEAHAVSARRARERGGRYDARPQ